MTNKVNNNNKYSIYYTLILPIIHPNKYNTKIVVNNMAHLCTVLEIRPKLINLAEKMAIMIRYFFCRYFDSCIYKRT